MSTTKTCVYGHASLRSVDVHTMQSYVCFRRIWMMAPSRRRARRGTLKQRLVIALMSGTQLSHRTFVVVLVSRSRASLGVALSTCQQLLAVRKWRGIQGTRCRGAPLERNQV